jgi:hypothetical protein
MPVKKKAPKEPEESFSLVDHTASLDPFTLEKRIDAESSLYRWAQVVIGYENLPADCNYRLYEPIHRPMCDRVEAVPSDTAQTSRPGTAWLAQDASRNRDRRALLPRL